MATPSLESATSEYIDEIIRQAELRLEAQLSAALAADQRAMTFAGLLFAGIAVLMGGGGISISSTYFQPALIFCIGFALAAGCASWSARPAKWHYVGNFPASWNDDLSEGISFAESRRETATHFQEMLELNERALTRASRWMRASMILAISSVVFGLLMVACASN